MAEPRRPLYSIVPTIGDPMALAPAVQSQVAAIKADQPNRRSLRLSETIDAWLLECLRGWRPGPRGWIEECRRSAESWKTKFSF